MHTTRRTSPSASEQRGSADAAEATRSPHRHGWWWLSSRDQALLYGAALLLIAAIVIHQMRARTQDATVVQSHGEIRYRMDVNTATVAELDLLPGVGPRKAAAIMAYRKEHGAFHTLADLANVQGVSLALAESLRELVLIDGKTKGTE